MKMQSLNGWAAAFCLLVIFAAREVHAVDLDNLVTVVGSSFTNNGGTAIGTFGYDPSTDSMYISSFGSGGNLHRINNVGGTQTLDLQATATELQLYYRSGNTDRSVSTPSQSGFLLNPQPIGAAPAYSFAVITDLAVTNYSPTEPGNPNPGTSNTVYPAESKRVYTYNLGSAAGGNQVFTTKATTASMQAAVGATSTTTNIGRQFAWAGDGQSIYYVDTTSTYGGVWKVSNLTGASTLTRILDATNGGTITSPNINTEPAVVTSGGVDTIYFAGGGSTANTGGIDKMTYNPTTGVASGRQVAVTVAALADFFQLTAAQAASISVASMATDPDGTIYFNNTNGTTGNAADRRGIYRIDPQGRISKVLGFTERNSELGVTNSNTLRMQPRTVNFTGPSSTFPVTQIMYAESAGASSVVAGAYAFKPGDFNRDNALTAADISLLKPKIGLVGATPITAAGAADLKFDMNGSNTVDWKDVKVLQQVADFGNADADLNGVVDNLDFQTLQTNYGVAATKTWLQGDFTGDNIAGIKDFFLLQNSMNYQSSVLTGVVGVPLDTAAFAAFIASKINGDFNLDNQVNLADVTAMLKALTNLSGFESTNGLTDANLLALGDFNGDGFITNADIQPLLDKLAGAGSITAVPEPSTAVFLLLGLGFTIYRHSKTAVRRDEVCA